MIDDIRRLSRPLFFLYGGTIVTRMGAFVFPYLTIYLSDSRGFGLDHVGLILSTGSLGLLLGNFAGGWLTDRWSRKWTLIAALFINALGFAGLAFEYGSGWQYALFLMIGYFGSGMYNPAANTLIADLTDESIRPFAYTMNYVCVNIGMALGPLIGGFLATIAYRWIFVGDVLTSLICAALIFFGVRETFRHVPCQEADARRSIDRHSKHIYHLIWFRHPLVLAFCLSYFFLICPLMGLEYAVPILVKNTFASSLAYVGIIYTINAVCILSLSFLIEKFIRRRSEIRWMIVAGIFWSAGLAILLFGYSIPAMMICTVVWTIGEIIASIIVPTFIAERVDHQVKGRFLALNDIVRSFAGVVCPIGLGLVWTHRGPTTVLTVLTALPVIGVAAYVAILAVEHSKPVRASSANVIAHSESQVCETRVT
jgi:MFS family permease